VLTSVQNSPNRGYSPLRLANGLVMSDQDNEWVPMKQDEGDHSDDRGDAGPGSLVERAGEHVTFSSPNRSLKTTFLI
jgi:hypothetical protein